MNKVLGNKKSIAVFVLPAFLIYAIFVLVPIGYNVYVSFLQTDLMSPSKFVGIKNNAAFPQTVSYFWMFNF